MLIPQKAFKLHAITSDSSRYALGNVEFSRDKDGNPQAAATDGRSMAIYSWPENLGVLQECEEKSNVIGTAITRLPMLIGADTCRALSKKSLKLKGVVADEANMTPAGLQGGGDVTKPGSISLGVVTRDGWAKKEEAELAYGRFPHWYMHSNTPSQPLTVKLNLDNLVEMVNLFTDLIDQNDEGERTVNLTLSQKDLHDHDSIMLTSIDDQENKVCGILACIGEKRGCDLKLSRPTGPQWQPQEPVYQLEESAAKPVTADDSTSQLTTGAGL